MAAKSKEIKDAPIPNTVNPNSIKENLKKDNYVSAFAREGAKLLEKTNRPNVITVDQFMPFIPLFSMGEKERERYSDDENYRTEMNRLYNRYVRSLEINLFEPTIVIRSKEDPVEQVVLNRLFTRIQTDVVEAGKSSRDSIPSAVARNASTTRDQMIQDASVKDLIEANHSPQQLEYFRRVRIESALIQKRFVERNMSPEAKAKLLGETSDGDSVSVPTTSPRTAVIFDDDD